MSHVIDYDKPVSNITITLLTNDDDPEQHDLIQAVSDAVFKALKEVRVNFPCEKWEYFGVHYEEWLADEPMDEPYLESKGTDLKALWKELGDIPTDEKEEIEEPFIHFPIGTNYMEIWHWFDEQNFEFPWKKGLSREKKSPSVDKETSHEGRKVNEGVAPHVITRKYFPLEKCISCYQRNTDFCRLACEEGEEIE